MEFITHFKINKYEKRVKHSKKLLLQYPTRVPVVIDRLSNKNNMMKKNKYLIERDMNIGSIIYIIRKYLKLSEMEEAIFLFTSKKYMLLNLQRTIGEIYNLYSEEDGYLYLLYMKENTFGK